MFRCSQTSADGCFLLDNVCLDSVGFVNQVRPFVPFSSGYEPKGIKFVIQRSLFFLLCDFPRTATNNQTILLQVLLIRCRFCRVCAAVIQLHWWLDEWAWASVQTPAGTSPADARPADARRSSWRSALQLLRWVKGHQVVKLGHDASQEPFGEKTTGIHVNKVSRLWSFKGVVVNKEGVQWFKGCVCSSWFEGLIRELGSF